MRKIFVLAAVACLAAVCSAELPKDLVLVEGGTFKNMHSNFYGKAVTLSSFYIGKYDVTQKEWTEMMGSNPSKFKGENLPVESVNWYDSIEYCNRRSLKEHLKPYYNIDKHTKDPANLPDPKFGYLDQTRWTVTINPDANGYRLPTEAEWEYAAGGGRLSKSYLFSGSNDVEEVAWYWRNAGDAELKGYWYWPVIDQNHDRTHPVGTKKPNELGLYDMSGNVRQWCWDWYGDLPTRAVNTKGSRTGYSRVWKGGGWIGDAPFTATAFRGNLAANGSGPDQGLRICRNR